MTRKITQDMVGLKYSVVSNVETDFDENRVKIVFEEISQEGLAVFGIDPEEEAKYVSYSNTCGSKCKD